MLTTTPVSGPPLPIGVLLDVRGRVEGHRADDLDHPRVDADDARVAATAAPPGPLPKILRRGVQPTSRQFVRSHPPGCASTPVAAGPRRRGGTDGAPPAGAARRRIAHVHARADPVRVERIPFRPREDGVHCAAACSRSEQNRRWRRMRQGGWCCGCGRNWAEPASRLQIWAGRGRFGHWELRGSSEGDGGRV
eukprot:scaffold7575_cov102-Isochrysis_galbana.AAC.5